jgi:hypothetical protein
MDEKEIDFADIYEVEPTGLISFNIKSEGEEFKFKTSLNL